MSFSKKLPQNYREVIKDFFHILFIVSTVFVLHHKTPFFEFFDKLAFSITSIMNSPVEEKIFQLSEGHFPTVYLENGKHESVNLLLISKRDYVDSFGSISPLDRCYLADVLEKKLLNSHIKNVVFDIDVAPICEGAETSLKGKYLECQKKLDDVLIKLIQDKKNVVMIPPSVFQDTNLKGCSNLRKWQENLENLGVTFLSPSVISSFGVVLYYPIDSLGSFVLKTNRETEEELDKPIVINYANLNLKRGKCRSNTVFVGGIYDPRDFLITPIGKLPGVVVHALGYLSVLNPIKVHSVVSKLIAFLLDLTSAIVISFLFKKLWRSFIVSRYSYMKFLIFTLILSVAIGLFVISSFIIVMIYRKFNMLISFIPLLIGIFFDSFNNSLLEVIDENYQEKGNFFIKNDYINRYLEGIYTILKLTIIAYALNLIIFD